MKRFIDTLKNIWAIKELRNRLLYTLILLVVFRLGSYIVLPGVMSDVLSNVAKGRSANDLLGLINIFTGGAFNQASILALGIMPYITASIIIQVLGFAVPYFQRLQQKEGESGRKKLNQITRVLTVAITLVQGGAYLTYLKGVGAISPNIAQSIFWGSNILILTTGTVFAMWLDGVCWDQIAKFLSRFTVDRRDFVRFWFGTFFQSKIYGKTKKYLLGFNCYVQYRFVYCTTFDQYLWRSALAAL